MGLLRQRFALSGDAEVAVEIDPRTFEQEMGAALGEAGGSRASLGVQSFDPVVQKAINRVQRRIRRWKRSRDCGGRASKASFGGRFLIRAVVSALEPTSRNRRVRMARRLKGPYTP